MKTKYSYYRHLLHKLGDRGRELRFIIIDRLFFWAEYHREQSRQRLAAYDQLNTALAGIDASYYYR